MYKHNSQDLDLASPHPVTHHLKPLPIGRLTTYTLNILFHPEKIIREISYPGEENNKAIIWDIPKRGFPQKGTNLTPKEDTKPPKALKRRMNPKVNLGVIKVEVGTKEVVD